MKFKVGDQINYLVAGHVHGTGTIIRIETDNKLKPYVFVGLDGKEYYAQSDDQLEIANPHSFLPNT
jgi:hypothetical protein